jgi:hypothetical protein
MNVLDIHWYFSLFHFYSEISWTVIAVPSLPLCSLTARADQFAVEEIFRARHPPFVRQSRTQ